MIYLSKEILIQMYNGEIYPAEAINRDIPISGDISIFVYPEKKTGGSARC